MMEPYFLAARRQPRLSKNVEALYLDKNSPQYEWGEETRSQGSSPGGFFV